MGRAIHADVITEIAKNTCTMAHLVFIDFATPVFITDCAHDLTSNGNTYQAGGHLVNVSPANENSDLRVGMLTITLSGVNQAYISILLNQSYVNRQASISRVFLDDSGQIIGSPVLLYDGRLDSFTVNDSKNASQISLVVASHWADFERRSGRRTNVNSQKLFFPADKGFSHAAQMIRDLKWGRAS